MKEDGADAAGGIDAAWFRRIVVKGVVFWVTFFLWQFYSWFAKFSTST